MNILSQIEEKKDRKYSIVNRSTQAIVLDDHSGLTQRDLAAKYDIPRTTLQHWINRKKELKEQADLYVVEFFESPSGQAWLHRMIVATLMVFHQNGNSGIPNLHEFFCMTGIDLFVGVSVSALQKVSKMLDKQIITFGKEESEKLARNMPHKNITGALDENFIMDKMTLILMDPVSGFILAEQLEEKRDTETWHKVIKVALKGLNVSVNQLVGDEAGALNKLAKQTLCVLKGSDLFHIQQEITKGLTSHLARTLQQKKTQIEDLEEEKLETLAKFEGHLKAAGGIDELSIRGINAGKRIIEIEKGIKTTQKEIEVAENHYKMAQEARREITQVYHPFSLDTGEKQSPEIVKTKLEASYKVLENIAKEVNCTDKQKQKLEKSKKALGSMIDVLMFFFSFLTVIVKSMGLDEAQGGLFEKCVSIQYLKLCLQRTKKEKQREKIRVAIQKQEDELANNPLWGQIAKAVQTEWWRRALECAHVFQRSSSCVEGRNGQLSLKYHAFRRVSDHTLNVLTVLHNFFIKRMDGTTAAERFFEQKPQDLFLWLLDKVELPRPREKHKNVKKIDLEKQVA